MEFIIQRQKALIEKFRQEGRDENDPALGCFVIFDDVVSDRGAMQWCTEINRFFVQGRHLKISVFITTQHVKGIGPLLRGNLDMVVMQPMFSHDAREELAKLFAGFAAKQTVFQFFDEVIDQTEEPDSTPQDPKIKVRTLVIKDWINTPLPSLKFMYGEADNPDDYDKGWRLCHPEYWKQQENALPSGPTRRTHRPDVYEQLQNYRAIQSFRF